MFPEDQTSSSKKVQGFTISKTEEVMKLEENPPTEILMLMHSMSRKLHLGETVEWKLIDKILACSNLSKGTWDFNPIADWIFTIIAFQPTCLKSGNRIAKAVSIWKRICPTDAKIINPRNLTLLTKSGFNKTSWIVLGKLTQMLLREGVITPNELEKQCLEFSRNNWCNTWWKNLMVSEYLTMVMDTYSNKKTVDPIPSTSTQS